MAEYTENYSLKKPAQEDFYNVEDFNNNADVIDKELKAVSDKANSALPTTSYTADDILNKLKTVDGANSGLDADLFKGKSVIPIENGGTGANTVENALQNLGLDTALRRIQGRQFVFNTTNEAGWYTLLSFPAQEAGAIIRLFATGNWEESLWIFVDSNFFSVNSPTINIIGNTYTTMISKFRCNCSTSGTVGTFTLDAYITPVDNCQTLQVATYYESKSGITIPNTITPSTTIVERAVVNHSAPCGFESSYMANTIQSLLQSGGVSVVKSVQRGVITLNNEYSSSATINSVNTNKAIVIYGGNNVDGSSNNKYFAYLTLTNSTTVTATNTSGSGVTNVPYQVIEYY